jgi:hypothetical protein
MVVIGYDIKTGPEAGTIYRSFASFYPLPTIVSKEVWWV